MNRELKGKEENREKKGDLKKGGVGRGGGVWGMGTQKRKKHKRGRRSLLFLPFLSHPQFCFVSVEYF